MSDAIVSLRPYISTLAATAVSVPEVEYFNDHIDDDAFAELAWPECTPPVAVLSGDQTDFAGKWQNFGKLPTKVQKRVAEWIDIFQENPNDPSIGLHSLKATMVDPKVRGDDLPGGYRAIIVAPEKGDTYLLVHIDAHDKAYNWAKNKHFEVHSATGVFQLFDVEETQTAVQKQAVKTESENNYPLSGLSDDELFKIGIPQPFKELSLVLWQVE